MVMKKVIVNYFEVRSGLSPKKTEAKLSQQSR